MSQSGDNFQHYSIDILSTVSRQNWCDTFLALSVLFSEAVQHLCILFYSARSREAVRANRYTVTTGQVRKHLPPKLICCYGRRHI